MKCVSFRLGQIESFIFIKDVQGKPSVSLGEKNQRVELVRSGLSVIPELIFHAVPETRKNNRAKKRGNRLRFHVLRSIHPMQDSHPERVIIHFNTDYPKAQMILIYGTVIPLADSRGHYCNGTDISSDRRENCRPCAEGGAVVILYSNTTARLWDRHEQVFDITNKDGKVTCQQAHDYEDVI